MTLETSADQTSSFKSEIFTCMRDMNYYARISGLHVLECVMDVALAAVKREHLEEASNILSLYPQLQPLVAVMGCDVLPGKTDIRRKLLQLLWTSKSQILWLEESSFSDNKSDEVLFYVVPDIRFEDAIELFSMQPITSNLAAWKSKQSKIWCSSFKLNNPSFVDEEAIGSVEKPGTGAKILHGIDVLERYLNKLNWVLTRSICPKILSLP
ncbi:hypothetical protein CTI12_AA228630 [Artemisia annua]|uniref:Uncharacterized protein n=1 Tax=Artemisia annua TaxID=35608 RepID=A0A2U1NU75_ARTAN|nr:hypothetical protein CTI12_AA228630 [Artemisia annua]